MHAIVTTEQNPLWAKYLQIWTLTMVYSAVKNAKDLFILSLKYTLYTWQNSSLFSDAWHFHIFTYLYPGSANFFHPVRLVLAVKY